MPQHVAKDAGALASDFGAQAFRVLYLNQVLKLGFDVIEWT